MRIKHMSFSYWRLVLSFLMHGFKFNIYNLVLINTCIFQLFNFIVLVFSVFFLIPFVYLHAHTTTLPKKSKTIGERTNTITVWHLNAMPTLNDRLTQSLQPFFLCSQELHRNLLLFFLSLNCHQIDFGGHFISCVKFHILRF